jgi:hypothetical protein
VRLTVDLIPTINVIVHREGEAAQLPQAVSEAAVEADAVEEIELEEAEIVSEASDEETGPGEEA